MIDVANILLQVAQTIKVSKNKELLEQNSDNKEVVLQLMKTEGYLLWMASPRLRDDKEVVMTAVASAGWALGHASDRLKADKEVVTTALKHDRAAWPLMAIELVKDETFFFKYKIWKEEDALWYVKPYRA